MSPPVAAMSIGSRAPGTVSVRGVISLSVPHHRLSNQGICVGEETAVYIAQWRGGIGQQCVARVSGPIRDSRVSGLWSHQN